MDKWEYQNKPCYLENRVVREPCKQRTACTLDPKNNKLFFRCIIPSIIEIFAILVFEFLFNIWSLLKIPNLSSITYRSTKIIEDIPFNAFLLHVAGTVEVHKWSTVMSCYMRGNFNKGLTKIFKMVTIGRFYSMLCTVRLSTGITKPLEIIANVIFCICFCFHTVSNTWSHPT